MTKTTLLMLHINRNENNIVVTAMHEAFVTADLENVASLS